MPGNRPILFCKGRRQWRNWLDDEKGLANFIRVTKQNKLIVGYGGVDKYYSIGE